jgi:hypothetical protein
MRIKMWVRKQARFSGEDKSVAGPPPRGDNPWVAAIFLMSARHFGGHRGETSMDEGLPVNILPWRF